MRHTHNEHGQRQGASRRFIARHVAAVMLLWCAAVCTVHAEQAGDAEFLARVRADTHWMNDYGTRQVGTAAHARLQDDLIAKLREVPGVEVWTDEFPVVVPIHEETYLEVTEGLLQGRHDMFPIWPDGARLNTTPAGGIVGSLIYVGDASFDRLPARGLRGQIAVMEASAYAHYRRVFDYGAAAVIFVESDEVGMTLVSQQSLFKPRYYVQAGPLADALRAGDASWGRIVCRGRWDTVTARNIYVGVTSARAAGAAPYTIVAPYDSMSRVHGVAPGADAALDCAIVLNLLRDAAHESPRPLLFGFLDAYHINQVGMRRMAAMLTVTPDGRTRRSYVKLEQQDLDSYRAAAAELARFDTPEAGLASLHDRSACQNLRRLFKDAIGRDLLRLRELQGELRLAASRTGKETLASIRQQTLAVLDDSATWLLQRHRAELLPEEVAKLNEARAFVASELDSQSDTFAGVKTWAGLPAAREHAEALVAICAKPLRSRNRTLDAVFSQDKDVAAEDMPVALTAWGQMAQRILGQVAEQEQRVAFFEPLDRMRAQIAAHFELNQDGEDRRISPFVIGIDLSDCGVLVGPGLHCSYNRMDLADRDFLRAIRQATRRGDIWPEDAGTRQTVNISGILGRPGSTSEMGERALITSAATSFLLSGVTWVTDDAPRQRTDSPLDRYDHLDWDRIAPQLPPTRQFLQWLLTTSDFTPTPRLVSQTTAKWRHGMGRIVDISAGETVPRVPRRGFLATFIGYTGDRDGIRRNEFALTGHDGSFRVPLMCADVHRFHLVYDLQAFILTSTGAIVESLSTSESMVTARLATTFNLGTGPGEQLPRAVTFRCTELNGPSFYDARFLEPLTQGSLLDAVRGGPPKQSHFSIDRSGQMWGLVSPGTLWQLSVRAGASGIRMALLNAVSDGRERGLSLREAFQRGFLVDNALSSIPAELSARDIFALNEWRLTDFRAAGIQSDKIDAIRAMTRQSLDDAETAVADGDGAALQRAATRALASEIRAYRAIAETGHDIARGAIFLMLILVPFCVAMERLLFACPRIGTQIAAAIGIFAVMTLLLWSFHPAFQISAQPLVIVMAFTILAMSLVVISMVLARFRASMREFQSSMAEGSGAQMGRGGLLGSAVFLGIANMRKRKVRTALTGATIVLVTFALLCFSSASSYVDKKDFRLEGVQAQHASVMIRRPTFGPINWQAVDGIRNLLGIAGVDVEARSWLVSGLADTNWRLWMLNPTTGRQTPIRGALGLPPNEHLLSGVDRVLPNWSLFAEQGGCYLSAEMAEQLGVAPGDRIVVRGRDVILRGVFDPLELEDQVSLLDGQRILPYDYSRQEQDWVNRDSQDAIEQEAESAAAMQPTAGNDDLYLAARDVILLPTQLLRELGGDLRSVGIVCASPQQAAQVARSLMETIVYPAYYANDSGGVNVVVATPLIAVPPRNLAVPLVIAALIIFTTMLNSVSERKKEIYVYSSLGLAPIHIGALFVAEALTYGLMGSVFGYIAGQGTATLLTHVGWMQGITLNYSGTAVIKTMLLVQCVVVMAAIVPAIIAGRIASPSSEMDWKVPEPVDGQITSSLPFTVSPAAASGLLSFIYEYLEAHRDGVLGRFDVDAVRLLPRDSADYVAGLEARVWLAPFDMGVRQLIRLTIENPHDGACDIAVRIHHETGTPKLWWRLNRPFFYELRRQLLGWRKVAPERMREYINRLNTPAVQPEPIVR
jgi:hypothetical protein